MAPIRKRCRAKRDLRLLSCEGAHVAASATLAQCALTQKGEGGYRQQGTGQQKQIPRAKCALVMTTWRSGGEIVVRLAEVAAAVILGQRDLRLLSCEGAYVGASATLAQCALTQKGEGGVCGQKQIPRAKCALVMTAFHGGRLREWVGSRRSGLGRGCRAEARRYIKTLGVV